MNYVISLVHTTLSHAISDKQVGNDGMPRYDQRRRSSFTTENNNAKIWKWSIERSGDRGKHARGGGYVSCTSIGKAHAEMCENQTARRQRNDSTRCPRSKNITQRWIKCMRRCDENNVPFANALHHIFCLTVIRESSASQDAPFWSTSAA